MSKWLEIREIYRNKQNLETQMNWNVDIYSSSNTICKIRAGNLELGNRYPNSAGIYSKTCPLCCKQGLGLLPLDETHLLFFCKSLERVRKQQNISNFITESQYPRISRDDLLRKYISNPDTTTTELMRRGRAATILKEKWLSLL